MTERKGSGCLNKKFCSETCRRENLKNWYLTIGKKMCRLCRKEFEMARKYIYKRKYCPSCTNKAKSISKIKSNNQNWTGGKEFHKKPIYSLRMRRHNFVCQQFKKKFQERTGYCFCEVCKRSDQPTETHHLIYVSRAPRNEFLHHPANLMLVCRRCHLAFHGGTAKDIFAKIDAERGLSAMFKTGRTEQEPPVYDFDTGDIGKRCTGSRKKD
jgi:5-methylcytosine-specific restriction endonuclease McrA